MQIRKVKDNVCYKTSDGKVFYDEYDAYKHVLDFCIAESIRVTAWNKISPNEIDLITQEIIRRLFSETNMPDLYKKLFIMKDETNGT